MSVGRAQLPQPARVGTVDVFDLLRGGMGAAEARVIAMYGSAPISRQKVMKSSMPMSFDSRPFQANSRRGGHGAASNLRVKQR